MSQFKVTMSDLKQIIQSEWKADTMSKAYDLAVVGAGIVGLACALAAVRRGKRVVVFITITGQERGDMWTRAKRTRDVWVEVAQEAKIDLIHRGLVMAVRRDESMAVLETFLKTEMGQGCTLLDAKRLRADHPHLNGSQLMGGLWSPHEVRVESRQAIPMLAAWLADHHGVTFLRQTAVVGVETGKVYTAHGLIEADAVAVCPGDDLISLFPDRVARYDVTRCKLQMLRLADPGFRLSGAIMSDLGLVRYAGYSALPEAAAVRARLEAEQAEQLAHGIHLIVVQSADGSLVVGDSHHYGPTPDPFASQDVDRLILDEYEAVFGSAAPPVQERWTGTYASAPDRTVLIDQPCADVRLVMVTTGAGASTGFALGEEVIDGLFGRGIG
jgi:D-hydroxyproline dehydrogenase subunit beta